jgi:GT2 family glycosyltransferase
MDYHHLRQRAKAMLPTPVYRAGQRVMQAQRATHHTLNNMRVLNQYKLLNDVIRNVAKVNIGSIVPSLYRLRAQEIDKIAQAHHAHQTPTAKSPEQQPSVTIVLLSLDRWHLTQRCLQSIYAHSDYPFQVLIFDNGSQPETVAHLRAEEERQDDLRVIYCPTNLGVAGGRNRAFAAVETDYVISLDNDMICHPSWLKGIMACALRHQAAFVCPLLLDPRGNVWAAGADLVRTYNETVVEIEPWFHDLPLPIVQALLSKGDFATTFVFGGAGLYSTSAFHTCQGLADYFVGWEDIDFSLRLAELGYKVWVTSQSVVTHDHEWKPQTQADVDYVRKRYDIDRLRQAAQQFEARWGVQVFTDQSIAETQERIRRKAGATIAH